MGRLRLRLVVAEADGLLKLEVELEHQVQLGLVLGDPLEAGLPVEPVAGLRRARGRHRLSSREHPLTASAGLAGRRGLSLRGRNVTLGEEEAVALSRATVEEFDRDD